VFGTYKLWWAALASMALAIGVYCRWLWTGTALIPEKDAKDVGLGLRLPLYLSGSSSVGWWAVFITMIASQAAFWCLVFGYFFYWSLAGRFLPADASPGVFWPGLGAALLVSGWLLVFGVRRANRAEHGRLFYLTLGAALICAVAGQAALAAGAWLGGLSPTRHVYDATIWLLIVWCGLHVLTALIMLAYCGARRAAGRMTGRYDADLENTLLFWHFTVFTVVVTVAVISGFPLLAHG
jgi:cytochrome c oxidase subunit I+III